MSGALPGIYKLVRWQLGEHLFEQMSWRWRGGIRLAHNFAMMAIYC